MEETGPDTSRWKWWAALAILIVGIITVALFWGLYQLGGADQAPLERIRDIAVIFLTFQLVLVTLILAGIAAALIFLIMVLKDQVIPLLAEVTQTARRIKGTTEFVSEEAVRPIITTAGQIAKLRAMARVVSGATKRGDNR
ncbi:MAG: hypothetical protein U0031_12285 [Thermomicrobiales bacterium]